MQIIYDQKAKDYIRDKNFTDIYIWPVYNGGMCLGLKNIRLEIRDKAKDDRFFIRDWFDGINTNYDPSINQFKRSSIEIQITAFGIGGLRKLVTKTEFTSMNLSE